MDIPNKIYRCEKCRDTGKVKEANGDVHTCWDCLRGGRLGQHSDKLPPTNVRIY